MAMPPPTLPSRARFVYKPEANKSRKQPPPSPPFELLPQTHLTTEKRHCTVLLVSIYPVEPKALFRLVPLNDISTLQEFIAVCTARWADVLGNRALGKMTIEMPWSGVWVEVVRGVQSDWFEFMRVLNAAWYPSPKTEGVVVYVKVYLAVAPREETADHLGLEG